MGMGWAAGTPAPPAEDAAARGLSAGCGRHPGQKPPLLWQAALLYHCGDARGCALLGADVATGLSLLQHAAQC